MLSRAQVYLVGLVVGSVLVASYEAIVYAYYLVPSAAATYVWPIAFIVLLILWVLEDSRGRPEVYRPFRFGFLMFLFWLPYLPYYLWCTRRGRGLLMLLGFIALYVLGTLAKWSVYALSES